MDKLAAVVLVLLWIILYSCDRRSTTIKSNAPNLDTVIVAPTPVMFDSMEIDGPMAKFKEKMLSKGYELTLWIDPVIGKDTTRNGEQILPAAFFRGNVDYPNMSVVVVGTWRTKIVNQVVVVITPRSRDTLVGQQLFNSVLTSLLQKYGTPRPYAPGIREPGGHLADEDIARKYLLWRNKGVSISLSKSWFTEVRYENFSNTDNEKKKIDGARGKIL